MDPDGHQPCTGRRVLIVEDEWLIALELQEVVEHLGYTVVGPVGSIEDAINFISERRPDAALLDVNVRGRRVGPVAIACEERGIPFALVTGYGRLTLDDPILQSAPRVHKPFDDARIQGALATIVPGSVSRVRDLSTAGRPSRVFSGSSAAKFKRSGSR